MKRVASGGLAFLLAAVSLITVTAVGPAVASEHSEFTPVADSYVDASRADRNYGNRNHVRIDASPVRNAYIKFDVQGQGTVSSAVLRIYAESGSNAGFEVRTVTDTTWDESTITYNIAPAVGPVIVASGFVGAGSFTDVDVSSAITGDGLVTLALTTTATSAAKYTSSEGANPPTLFIPGPPNLGPFFVTGNGTSYDAVSQATGRTFSGSLKSVVESATSELNQTGGGVITFDAGTFDLGSDHFEFYDVVGITFEGQGIDVTTIQNNSSDSTDTEPFDFTNSTQLAIRDMTVFAGGPLRSTSDALDFDGGDDVIVERVKVTGSRGRGIVFDGKETTGSGTANRNVIRDCSISNVPGDGIELLASSDDLIENCTITDVGGHGIQLNKASSSAQEPNKQSTDNVIQNNTITDAGQDGVNINSGTGNQILDNVITNSSDDTTGRDGIRIDSFDGVACDGNVIAGNVATDNQSTKTQKYGLDIRSANCNGTVIGAGNDFSGNLVGAINDNGTNTQYPNDTEAPTAPSNLTATTVEFNRVDLAWDAATDNVGVNTYTVYRDGGAIDSVDGSTLTFTDATVAAESTYTYEVEASDAVGNISPLSDPLVVVTPAVSPAVTVIPVADAYVNAANPALNYGMLSDLRVDASPVLRSYLRFDVSGLGGPVTSATLRVFAKSNHSSGFEVRDVADDSWAETTITYDTAPAPGALLGGSGALTAGTWVEIDVTSHVTGDDVYSLALTPLTNTNLRLDSREGANPPELAITTDLSGNTPPTADDLVEETDEDAVLAWAPSVSDAEGGPFTCTITSQPSNGTATVASDCSSGTYTPNGDFNGADTFIYQATDTGGMSDTGNVDVTVAAINDAPTADDGILATTLETPVVVLLSGGDVDGECPLTFEVVTQPSNGSVGPASGVQCTLGAATADVTYTPNPGFTGPDPFTYRVLDPSSATSAAATVTVTVDAPQTSFTFTPAADAYVSSSSSGTNFGSSSQLRVDGSPVLRSYLRFDVSGVSGSVTSATLRVFAKSRHSSGFEVRDVADDSWGETTITFDTAPAPGALLGNSGALTAGTWVEIDVTSYVTGDDAYSLALTAVTNTNLRLDSRQGTNAPELVIETG